jgi:tetratricopeptide (TPR) repeat protein
MKLGHILAMPIIAALLSPPSIGQPPEFDWNAMHRHVNDLLQQGRSAESQTVLEKSVKAAHMRGERSAGLAKALNDLGTFYHDSGRFADADRAYSESLSISRRIQATVPEMAIAMGNLAGLRLAQGRPSDAEKLYVDAHQIAVSAYGAESSEVADLLTGLADVYLELGEHEKARQLGERALAVLETTGKDPRLQGVALFIVAKAAWKQNRDEEAERLLRRANEILRRTLGRGHPTYLSGLVSLATLVCRKNPSEGGQLFSDALQSIETQFGPSHVFTGYTLMVYARHLQDQGHKHEGKRLKRRGEEILARHSRENLLGHTFDIKAFQRPNARQ